VIARWPDAEARLPAAALRYAAIGWPTFPLAECGKVPMVSKAEGGRGYLDATTDEEQVRSWWTRWSLANIGIPTGRRFDVLDVDPDHGGNETLAALVAVHGQLPATRESHTGGGGRHFLFRPDARVRCSAGRLGPGLDVRGTGGYIVAPPSVHPNGRLYRWRAQDVALAPWPAWLLDRILPPPCRTTPPHKARPPLDSGGSRYALAVLRRACEAIEDAAARKDHRHDTLRARARTVAGFVGGGELAEDLARRCLLGAWVGADLEHRRVEAERTIEWAFVHGKAAPLTTPARPS